MEDTEKKSGLASRMENFYFDIEDPNGEAETIGGTEELEEGLQDQE